MQLTKELTKTFIEDSFADIIGQDNVKTQLQSALLSNRNVIIVGPPGVGKTTLAKNLAKLLPKHNFVRIQGSPDLTVEDLLGDIDPIKAMEFGPLSLEAFTKGKIFKADKGVLFFDEINRCPEKLQNALLQVLQEKKATIGSYDVDFDTDFFFIATMNPEDTTTEKLNDVLLDRFDVIYMSHPETAEEEREIVEQHGKKIINVPENLLELMVYFVRILRESQDLDKKPSVRATLGLYERAQAHAQLQKKKTTSLKDLQAIATSVLAHRISVKPSMKYLKSPEQLVEEEMKKVLDTNIGKELDAGDDP